MVAAFLAIVMLLALVALVRSTSTPGRDDRLMPLMVTAYLVRLVIQSFSRSLSLFSHGGGGDYIIYEARALEIIRYWSFFGFQMVSSDEMPELGPTTLPPHLFALIINLNGGEPTPLGCTALVAFMACVTCLNVYHLAVELGAEARRAFTIAALFLFSPAFLLYTSDMYKDGPVLFFSVAAVASAIRLSRRLSIVEIAISAASLLALWHVRFYLVFLASAPLLVGMTGFRAKSSVRPILATLALGAAFAIILGSTEVVSDVTQRAGATFAHATNAHVRSANATGGSGVTFDDGGNPWGAMGPKLAYMLFSPFPWAGGSVGFHIGKIDTFLWYYILFSAAKAGRRLWRADRTLLLMFVIVIVPMTVSYATTFANVGLSLRQRLVIVVLTAPLAMLRWPRRHVVSSRAPAAGVTEMRSARCSVPRDAGSAALTRIVYALTRRKGRHFMKVVILAGGLGTRISEETGLRPKPMVEVGGKPLLWHIMKTYAAHGLHEFVVCCGYKGYVIKEFFANYFLHTADVTIDLANNGMEVHDSKAEPWKVTLVDTGEHTMTGGRLKRIARYLDPRERFCMTYGDGLSDVDVKALIRFAEEQGTLATLTAVQPAGRFGKLSFNEGRITQFKEKPEGDGAWINGGFFVLHPDVLALCEADDTVWERGPLEKLSAAGQLSAFMHAGFWQPVDTLREKNLLEDLWRAGNAPWKNW